MLSIAFSIRGLGTSVVQGCGYGTALPNRMGFRTLSCRLMQVGRKRHPLLDGCRNDYDNSCT